jgi:uncharacterized protein YcsI (UPF0317 family)
MSELVFSVIELEAIAPSDLRHKIRKGLFTGETTTACRGYAQANLVVVPKEYAFDFLLFCNRNPSPCPLLEVTELGDPHPRLMAPEADLRTDLPKYRVFKDGKLVAEPLDVTDYWRDDFIAFLLGCSVGFVWVLRGANLKWRTLGIYTTTIPCVPAGCFRGTMAVTCRLFDNSRDVVRAIQISSRYPLAHGAPVHIGNPEAIGIKNLYQPDISTSLKSITPQKPDEIAMFWGCGVTPQIVALEAGLPIMITHYPAHMFITDRLIEELAVTTVGVRTGGNKRTKKDEYPSLKQES